MVTKNNKKCFAKLEVVVEQISCMDLLATTITP